jgi:hypothetical protein
MDTANLFFRAIFGVGLALVGTIVPPIHAVSKTCKTLDSPTTCSTPEPEPIHVDSDVETTLAVLPVPIGPPGVTALLTTKLELKAAGTVI